ncbi:hypothetical protein AC249_AIPGENE19755 [Exaiptasia diaphana]|nr:hypothetical protein AC249_AIPGENE19755 [Exaiptasia diaphana]
MATSLPFVGTIDSDDEIEILDEENDSDDEEELKKKKSKKKQNKKEFDENFQFSAGDEFHETTWNLDMAIKVAKKKENSTTATTSLQEKISKKRQSNKYVLPEVAIMKNV